MAAAEAAYSELEYERSRQLAREALESGGYGAEETARLLELIGTSSALLGDDEVSYDAYRRQLALDPDAEMDRSLSPELRTSFHRARGWWAAQATRLGIQLDVGDSGAERSLQFRVQVNDPLGMAESLVLNVRGEDDELLQTEVAASRNVVISLDEVGMSDELLQSSPAFFYALEVRDEHGNILLSRGTPRELVRIANPRMQGIGPDGVTPIPRGPDIWEEWWFWTIVGGVVAAGVAVGIYFAIPAQVNLRSGVEFGF